jgi:hypothetical protein
MERDDVVQFLPPTTADRWLGQTILPWRRYARPLGQQARCGQETGHFCVQLSVPIQDHVAIWQGSGNASRSCWMIHSEVGRGVTCRARSGDVRAL